MVDSPQLFYPNDALGMLSVKIFIVMVMVSSGTMTMYGNPLMVLECERCCIHPSVKGAIISGVLLILKFLLVLTSCTKSLEQAV